MLRIDFDISNFCGKKIVVFGDFMIDEYLDGSVSRISPEAPVPIVHIKSNTRQLGGAGNVVRNLSALGADVAAVGYISHDADGNWLIENLKSCGADVSGMIQSDDVITGIKTRVTVQNQQMLRYDNEVVKEVPVCFVEKLSSIIFEILSGASALIISDYGKGAVTIATAKTIISAATALGIPVVVDPKGTDYRKYSGATVCTPNMKEFQKAVGKTLTTEEEIAVAGKELCNDCNIRFILVTRSEKGVTLIDGSNGEKKDYPALAKQVADVTGAGDTVISVFTLCLGCGASYDECCRISNIAASIVVQKFGAAVTSFAEIEELITDGSKTVSKIHSVQSVAQRAEFLRQQGKRLVFTNGCFDIVHAGHISSFMQAREFGDVLFVGVNSDESIRRIKGEKRPIVTQENRLALLEALSCVDYLVLFEEDTPEKLIHAIKPDVLVKGKDWEGKEVAGGDFVKSYGGEVCFIELRQSLSTTNIINRILEVNKED